MRRAYIWCVGRRGAIGLLALALLVPAGNAVAAPTYAPLHAPGPALSVPPANLGAALHCTSGVDHAARNPVLLIPGTNLDPGPNFSWNYERALAAMGWPYCTVTLPDHTLDDSQVAGEFVLSELHPMARSSHVRVDVNRDSHGQILLRQALPFWP